MLQVAGEHPGRSRKLTVRPLRMSFDGRVPRHWMKGGAWETQLMNGLSMIFPPGERFFMRSVRALKHHVKDPALLEQVQEFLAQESLHSREHSTLNTWMKAHGIPVEKIERFIDDDIQKHAARRGDLDNLAMTVALEHFTALLAKLLIHDASLRTRFHESVLPLWYWHAIEELDHKAVAFDVYVAAGGGYTRRVAYMVLATFGLGGLAVYLQWRLMGREGPRNLGGFLRMAAQYLGPNGHLRAALPEYLSFYKPGFHPWQEDDRALIKRAERELDAMLEKLAQKSA